MESLEGLSRRLGAFLGHFGRLECSAGTRGDYGGLEGIDMLEGSGFGDGSSEGLWGLYSSLGGSVGYS